LRQMGENVEKPQSPAPVCFLMLENGEPMRNLSIRWAVKYDPPNNTSRGSGIDETDEDGVLRIERDFFKKSGGKLISLTFESYRGKEALSATFSVEVPAPSDLSQTTTVQVKTKPLVLTLEPSWKVDESETVQVAIQDLKTMGDYFIKLPRPYVHESSWITMPYAPTLTLPNLQPGKYRISVRLPRAAYAWMDIDHPQTEPPVMKLEPGADVKMKVRKPTDWRFIDRIYREGEDTSVDPWSTWTGLPVGRYRLRISPCDEPPQFEAIEIPFTIDENSPAVIDLGEVVLKTL